MKSEIPTTEVAQAKSEAPAKTEPVSQKVPLRKKKLTMNVTPELHDELTQMASERGITVTELFRRAIALEKFAYEHQDGELLWKKGNEIRQIVRA